MPRPSQSASGLAALGLLLVLAGCQRTLRLPDLGGLYDAAAQRHEPWRNPVIVIPGVLGSRLVDDASGRVVWGAFSGGSADPSTGTGTRLMALPMREGVPLAELVDGVRSDGALDRVRFRLLGLPVDLAAYAHILASLGVGGYRDETLGLAGAVDYGSEHFTCFQFDYDWRRDLVENARRFGGFVREKEAYVQAETARRFGRSVDEPVRFDVVAHSMGGLLLRWYLRYGEAEPGADGAPPALDWAGAAHVERAILIGPPNLGAAKSLRQLVEGLDLGFALPSYPAALVGTLPAVYQLLPRGRHGTLLDAEGRPIEDLYDPALWEREGWGLADSRQERVLRRLLPEVSDPAARRRIALDHQRKCLERASAVASALDAPAAPPPGTELFLIAGDSTPTPQALGLEARRSGVRVVEHGPGDGTVLRASALADERLGLDPDDDDWRPRLDSPIAWRGVLFLFSDHLGLTRDPGFTDNVLYLLLEDPREDGTRASELPGTARDP